MNIEDNTELLIQAATRGDTDEVERLIPISNPAFRKSAALRQAAAHGHAKCVQLLIPISNPKSFECAALTRAAQNGHIECLKLLIPVSNPKVNGSQALQWACYKNRTACIDLLFDVSEPEIALHWLKQNDPDELSAWQYLEQKICERQRECLLHTIPHFKSETYKNTRKI